MTVIKEGLIENKSSEILFYESEGAKPEKIAHQEIEHTKAGDIKYFRTSPKSKKKQDEYQVMITVKTMLIASHIQTNYGSLKAEYFTNYSQSGNLSR